MPRGENATHLVGLAVFAVYYLLWRLISPLVRSLLTRAKPDQTTAVFTGTIFKYGFLTVGWLHAPGAAGSIWQVSSPAWESLD